MADVKTDYPARFYVSYDATTSEPHPILGWYDVWGLSSVTNVPPAPSMIAVSADDWADLTFHACSGKAVQGGKIIDYTPAVPESAS